MILSCKKAVLTGVALAAMAFSTAASAMSRFVDELDQQCSDSFLDGLTGDMDGITAVNSFMDGSAALDPGVCRKNDAKRCPNDMTGPSYGMKGNTCYATVCQDGNSGAAQQCEGNVDPSGACIYENKSVNECEELAKKLCEEAGIKDCSKPHKQ